MGFYTAALMFFTLCSSCVAQDPPPGGEDKISGDQKGLVAGEYISCLMAGLFVCKKNTSGQETCIATGLSCELPKEPVQGCECFSLCSDCIWTPQDGRIVFTSGTTCVDAKNVAIAVNCADCNIVTTQFCWDF